MGAFALAIPFAMNIFSLVVYAALSLTSFRVLLKSYFLSEAFPDFHSQNRNFLSQLFLSLDTPCTSILSFPS